MHVLPDSFDDLRSQCLPRNPWHNFPFTTFLAMLAAIFALMVDSFSLGFFKKKLPDDAAAAVEAGDDNHDGINGNEMKELEESRHGHGHGHNVINGKEKLLRHRIVAQVN